MSSSAIVIGLLMLTAVLYLNVDMKASLSPPLSAEEEVDPTRWRHDGTQPLGVKRGNGRVSSNVIVRDIFDNFPNIQ